MRNNWFAPSRLRPVTSITGISPALFSGKISGIVMPNAALVLVTSSAGTVEMLLLLK